MRISFIVSRYPFFFQKYKNIVKNPHNPLETSVVHFLCKNSHRPLEMPVFNCLILSTNSVSSPTQLRLKSDPTPTAVGDDSELGRR